MIDNFPKVLNFTGYFLNSTSSSVINSWFSPIMVSLILLIGMSINLVHVVARSFQNKT